MPSPVPSPPPTPQCVQHGATFTITGAAFSSEACNATAALLNTDATYLAYNVTYMQPFSCVSCDPVPIFPNTGATCIANLTAVLRPLVLLQLYANLWASPTEGGPYGVGQYARRVYNTNPTCTPDSGCTDLFPRLVNILMGGGEATPFS